MIYKVIICGTGYHSRKIYRKFQKKLKILFFTDRDKNKIGKKIFGKKIISLNSLKKLNFDKILISGVYTNEIIKDLRRLKLNKKVNILTNRQIIASNKEKVLREKQTYKILKGLIPILEKNNIEYYFVASSLLSILRKENLSNYSDLDIAIKLNDFAKLNKNLNISFKNKYSFQINYFKNSRKIKKISIVGKNSFNKFEPASIDLIHFFEKESKFLISQRDKYLEFEKKIFKKKKYIKYKNLSFSVPFKTINFMKKMYGLNWKKKPKVSSENYYNFYKGK